MFELPGLPVDRVMAGPTLIAERTVMRIVIAMACHAVGFRVMKRRRRMALVTSDSCVCTDQRKAGYVMIKP